jgi:pyruvate kinase
MTSRATTVSPWNQELVTLLLGELAAIHGSMLALERAFGDELEAVDPARREGARNLLHYVALRQHELREIQDGLSSLGASSLGRAEAHVLDNVELVLGLLHLLAGREPPARSSGALTAVEGRAALRQHTDLLLGTRPQGRDVRIMVTLPSEAARDPSILRSLVAAGMDVCRINCAHDDPEAWSLMLANLRQAERELSRTCRVLMDLAGPKVRTGEVGPGPAVVVLRPEKDALGAVKEPARVWLTAAEAPVPPPSPAAATLPIPASALACLEPGQVLELEDARGKRRSLEIAAAPDAGGVWAQAARSAYVVPGTHVTVRGRHGPSRFRIGTLPALEGTIPLEPGERLILTAAPEPGAPARRSAEGRVLAPAHVSFTLPEVFARIHPGQHVWLDDGKIHGLVEAVAPEGLTLRIETPRPTRLGSQKGVNFPGVDLGLPALTAKDREDLRFVAGHADLVGLSFVREPRDVHALQALLAELGRPELGIVLKIETKGALERLPSLLLAALRSPASGVMIARGDLAVECGYERLAEAQEEILWLCEAAHVPVVWATQVLDGLTRKGRLSRSEVTDAAMGERAECVMLNKGPYVVEAVRVLDDILGRMRSHQVKKRSLLRALNIARGFGATELVGE